MVVAEKKPVSWGLIIFFFIVFWPVGLFLLVKRLSVDKSATIKNGKSLTIFSYVLMGLGVIIFFSRVSGPGDTGIAILSGLFPLVMFVGGGFLLNRLARKTTQTGERYKKYIALIVNQNQTSIDHIASTAGVPYGIVLTDLQKMISLGYFPGAYIDLDRGEIFSARIPQPQVFTQPGSFVQVQERVATCRSCGANNRVVGQVGECDYCSSPLQ